MEADLERVRTASSQQELVDRFRQFDQSAQQLMQAAAQRQMELKDPRMRDDLAAARALLKKHSMMLFTASKVLIVPLI